MISESFQMFVRFKHGTTYVYYNVEQFVFDELLSADSKGRFFNSRIKGIYNFDRM